MRKIRTLAAGSGIILICTAMLACGLRDIRREEILGFFPMPTDVPGWTTRGPAAHYDRTNMQLLISGDRESMREYGIVEAVVSEYYSINEQDRVIRVLILRASSPLDAFGLVGRACGFRGRKNIPEGYEDCGVTGKYGFVFRKREYFVEISMQDAWPGHEKDVFMFANHINEAMKSLVQAPLQIVYLPVKQQDRKELVYCKKGCNGVVPVNDAYIRLVINEGKERIVFYARRNSRESATREFYGLMRTDTPRYTLIRTGTYMAAYIELPMNRIMLVGASGPWLFGICDAVSLGEATMMADGIHREISKSDRE